MNMKKAFDELQKGDIALVYYPYTEDGNKAKIRPAVLIKKTEDKAFFVKISSVKMEVPLDHNIEHWQEAGLVQESKVVSSNILHINKSDYSVFMVLGRLHETDFTNTIKKIRFMHNNYPQDCSHLYSKPFSFYANQENKLFHDSNSKNQPQHKPIEDRMYFTKEEGDFARTVSLRDYFDRAGIAYFRDGYDYQYRLDSDHSFVFNPVKDKWSMKKEQMENDPSRNKGGNGAWSYIKYVEGLTDVEAVKKICALMNYKENIPISSQIKKPESQQEDSDKSIQDKMKDFVLPPKNETNSRVVAYLTKTRGLDYEIVIRQIHKGVLYEDERHNCVFVGQPVNNPQYSEYEGKVVYANLRGSGTYGDKPFKGDVSNSVKDFNVLFKGTNDTVKLFEAPIDALSEQNICKKLEQDYKADNRLCGGGASLLSLQEYLNNYPDTKNVIICTDNDEAGHKCRLSATEFLQEKYPDIKVFCQIPKNNDFNEDLIKGHHNINLYECVPPNEKECVECKTQNQEIEA